jgi:hypothetical protein
MPSSRAVCVITILVVCLLLLTIPIFPLHKNNGKVGVVYPRTSFQYGTAHFVYGLWDDNEVPDNFKDTMKMWQAQGWTVKLWNKDMFDELLRKYPRYDNLPMKRKVQKADLARLLILYDEGGHYFDLDCVPQMKKPGELTLLQHLQETNPPVVFYVEMYVSILASLLVMRHKIRGGKPESLLRVANYAFGSHPQNPAILANLELLRERCLSHPEKNSDYDVLYKTGPDCTTTAINNYRGPKAIIDRKPWMTHLVTGTWRDGKDTH